MSFSGQAGAPPAQAVGSERGGAGKVGAPSPATSGGAGFIALDSCVLARITSRGRYKARDQGQEAGLQVGNFNV